MEKRKHITFQNRDGKKVRDSNLSKTFHLDISKEALENEFNGNRQKSRDEAERNSRETEELREYSRELESAIAEARGISGQDQSGAGYPQTEFREGKGAYANTETTDTSSGRGETDALIRQAETARRSAEIHRRNASSENRAVRDAETQSVTSAEQRRSEEQKRLEEQERARTARKRNKRRSDRNSKLQIQVNKSSVEAVEQAQQKQEEAEKQARQAEYQAERERKRADVEIQRTRRKAKSEIDDMKERQFFWDWGYLTVIFFSLLQNGAFQRDVLKLIMIPINWCKEYIVWLEHLEYVSNTAGEMLFKGIFSMLMIAAGIVGGVFLVWLGVEQYKKIWDDLYKMVWISSISFVAVLGNLIREYLPLNLILVVLLVNAGTILLRVYLKNKYPQMYD